MKRVTGIFEGEKLDMEKIPGKDNKLKVSPYIAHGRHHILHLLDRTPMIQAIG